ncbi:MAG: hypothetical protein ABSF63_09665 [Candidatus Bathyarchaeia archaeon]|jgi:ABC-type dipeptide/oligopeptide/nickel transport system permease subunit
MTFGVDGLRKRAALRVTVVAVVALTVVLNIGNVYAQTLNLTPNPVTQGADVVVSGSGYFDSISGHLQVFSTSSCAGSPQLNLATSSNGNGLLNPVTIAGNITISLSVGTHCVAIVLGNPYGLFDQIATSLTVNPAATSTTV